MRDLTRTRFGVQPFGITPLTVLQRGVTEHLEKVDSRISVHFTSQGTVLSKGADRRHQHQVATIGEQCGHMRQPAQVLRAVGHGKAQVGVEAMP